MRRKLIAAIAIVLGLVFLTVAAVATDSNRPLLSEQNGTFTFAPLAIGDHGTYSVEVVDADGNTIEEKRLMWELQWTNLTETLDHEGRERLVALAYAGSQSIDDDGNLVRQGATRGMEVGTWDLVHYSYLTEPTIEEHDDRLYEHWNEQRFFVTDELFVISCAMQNRLHGQTVDLGDVIEPFQHCSWWDYWAESTPLKAIETSEFQGEDAVTFRNERGHLQQATFAPSFSFPIQMVVERPDNPGTFHVIRLETFAAGDQPLPTATQPPGPAMFSPIQTTEWDRYPFGLIEQPYGLDAAITDARDHPEESQVRDWMDDHPRWFVLTASNWRSESVVFGDEKTTDTWNVELTDGASKLSFVLDRTTTEPAPPVDGIEVPSEIPTETAPEISFRTLHSLDMGLMPSVDDLPAQLPTAASVLPRWERMADHAEADAMRFHIQCITTCNELYYTVSVGRDWQRHDAGESEYVNSRFVYAMDTREGVGDSQQFYDSYSRWSYRDATAVASNEQSAVFATPQWVAPAEQAAFAFGSIGLLGGLAGFLWPTLRNASLIKLFSRIQADRLLEHPQRQRIMEVVYAEPGIHMRALRERLRMGSSVADHHIRKMNDAGLLHADRRGSYVCLFPKGHMDHSAMAAVPVMKADGAKAIVAALTKGPALQAELVEATGLSKGTLSYHLKRLAEANAVEFTKEGRARRVTLTELGAKAANAAPAA